MVEAAERAGVALSVGLYRRMLPVGAAAPRAHRAAATTAGRSPSTPRKAARTGWQPRHARRAHARKAAAAACSSTSARTFST